MLTKTRATLITLIATCSIGTTAIAPAVSQAAKVKPKPVTCEGGGKPGDIKTETFTIKINGKTVGTETVKSVCGSDGRWHETANLEVSAGTRGKRIFLEIAAPELEVSKSIPVVGIGREIIIETSA
jgi:hypothetical protein